MRNQREKNHPYVQNIICSNNYMNSAACIKEMFPLKTNVYWKMSLEKNRILNFNEWFCVFWKKSYGTLQNRDYDFIHIKYSS